MKRQIKFNVNGDEYSLSVDPCRTLNEVLREDLNLTGTKLGCGTGDCGACTVLLEGRSVNSCLTLAVTVDGKAVRTVEGLAPSGFPVVQGCRLSLLRQPPRHRSSFRPKKLAERFRPPLRCPSVSRRY